VQLQCSDSSDCDGGGQGSAPHKVKYIKHHDNNGCGVRKISFTFSLSAFFFLLSLTFENKSAVGFSMRKAENAPIFYNSHTYILSKQYKTQQTAPKRLTGFEM
jgi:hypothetical protein